MNLALKNLHDRRPRIATINTNFAGGGAAGVARSVWQAANESARYENDFFYSYGVSGSKGAHRIGWQCSKPWAALWHRLRGNSDFIVRRRTGQFIRHAAAADLVHLHNLHGYFIDPFALIDALARPWLWTLHDRWITTGRCSLALNCERWATGGCRACPDLRQTPGVWWHDRAANDLVRKRSAVASLLHRLPGYLVTPSRWLAGLVERSGVPAERIRVVPNGVDVTTFAPAEHRAALREQCNLPADRFLVLFSAARLSDPIKGAAHRERLIELFARHQRVHFVCIGETASGPARPHVTQLGYIASREKLAQVYAACDAFISTSLVENFPLCVLEAMSCGTPVLAFDAGGIREQLVSGAGEVISCGDDHALAQALAALARPEAAATWAAMGRAGRERCVSRYSAEKVFAQYFSLYDELLAAPAQRAAA